MHVCPAGPPACDYASIQTAVDAASSGTVIKVAAGAYQGVQQRAGLPQVVYISKTLTIQGGYVVGNWTAADPAANPTTLDAQGQGRGIYITGTIAPVIEGLRITGGDATGLGGGVWATAINAGGGVYVISATATLHDCVIYGNKATRIGTGAGGGVFLLRSRSTLANNTIRDNVSSQDGWGEGGGVELSSSDAVMVGNTIQDNVGSSADQGIGGGVYTEFSAITLHNNVIRGNAASSAARGDGGGVYFGPFDRSVAINTVVVNNTNGATADSEGAGIAVEMSYPHLLHTTIAGNTGGDGSGVYLFNDAYVMMTNTIVANQWVGVTATEESGAALSGVLWYGNTLGNTGGEGTVQVANARTGNPTFAADSYHLTDRSAAIDVAQAVGVTDDVDGQARPCGTLPDLGADE